MQITTSTVRLSYASLFEPRADLSGRMQYSCSLLIPKDSKDVNRIKEAFKKMLNDPHNKAILGGKTSNIDLPLRDGDEKEEHPEYAGMYYLNAKASENRPPKLFTKDLVELVDRDELYSGCYVQASLSLYCYNKNGHKGIGVGLRGIRKIKDGEPLSGSVVTPDEFSDSLVKDDLDDLF